MTPLITIGIPFYNAEKYLLNAIKSIFSQTYQNWELILIDDGSTDNSLKIANSISDERIKIIFDGNNKRLPARLNQIIDLANGKYIARMDADDMCVPERLEKQLKLLEENPQIDVVGTGVVYLDDDDIPLGISPATRRHEKICSKPYRNFGLVHASIVAKKSWYKQNRYDENALLVEDFKLWLESYGKSHFENVPDPLYYYRCETSFNQKKLFVARVNSIKLLFQHYVEKKQFLRAIYYPTLQVFKMIVGPIICLLKSDRSLIEKRYSSISSEEKHFHEDALNSIKEIELPIKGKND